MTGTQILLWANGRTRGESPLRAWLSGILGLDLRSLAVFRIGLGLLLLTDLILRSRDLVAFYTDDGILPRFVNVSRPSHLLLHQFSGSAWYQALLFIIAGSFALLMVFGCFTRVATCVSWLMLASLQARNPLTNDGAQDLLRLLVFWGMFLPLGARYSVDAAVNMSLRRRTRALSVATLALGLQMCLLYWISYRFKTHAQWRTEGSAVWYALSLDMLATPVGIWLRDSFPVLLRGLTYFVIWIELLAPLIFFFPWPNAIFRLVLITLMCGMHAGFSVCMWIELFPFICIVAWMAFLPTVVWDGLEKWLQSPRRRGLRLYFDAARPWSRRWALLARTICILPALRIRRLAVQPALAEAAQSFGLVLTDAQGRRYFGFKAVAEMMWRSPLLWPLGWLANKLPSRQPVPEGRAAPVRRSGTFDRLADLLPMRHCPPQGVWFSVGWWCMQAFVAVWVIYTIGYNLETVNIRAVNFGAIPEVVRHPSSFPDPLLTNGAGQGPWEWNFSYWMNTQMFWWGDHPITLPMSFKQLGLELRLDQYWKMFADKPLDCDGWFVFEARLEPKREAGRVAAVGRVIDLWTGEPVTFEKPKWPANTFPNYRWFKCMEKHMTWKKSDEEYYRHLGKYWLNSWNAKHPDEQLIELNVWFVAEISRPSYIQPVLDRRRIFQWCRVTNGVPCK